MDAERLRQILEEKEIDYEKFKANAHEYFLEALPSIVMDGKAPKPKEVEEVIAPKKKDEEVHEVKKHKK